MREIKFEVKFRRKDGTDSYISILTLDDLVNRNGVLYNSNLWQIVYKRQFTGLKDKNGKDIYNGDVICIINEEKYKVVWVVEWDASKWIVYNQLNSNRDIKNDITIFGDDCPIFTTDGQKYYKLEVFGNICEKSELL